MIRKLLSGILMLSVVMLIQSCNEAQQGNEPRKTEPQGHEEKALQVLLFGEGTELFAELQPHNGQYKIIAHLTQLSDYQPLASLRPEWILMNPESRIIRQVRMSHEHEGIYTATIAKPENEKTIHGIRFYHQGKEITLTIPQNNLSHALHDGGITYLKEQAWKDNFQIYRAKRKPFASIVKTSGMLKTSPDGQMIVTASSRGTVSFNQTPVIEGQAVTSQQAVLTIAGTESNLQNSTTAVRRAKIKYEQAKKEYSRAKALWDEAIISEKQYLEAQHVYDIARENYQVLSNNFDKGKRIMKAPVSGVIHNIVVENGDHVDAGQPLFTIIKKEPLILEADVSQQHYSKLPHLQGVSFSIPSSGKRYTYDNLPPEAIIYSRKMQSAFTSVSFLLPYDAALVPGTYAEVYLKLKEADSSLTIPKKALMESEGNKYVYVMTGGEQFEKREVSAGRDDGEHIVIHKGLKTGEVIVSQGAYNIKLTAMSGNLPSHNHSH
jgi:RND family efflux transporter MFP subunit